MNIREILKIQQAFENNTTPTDLTDEDIVYWSKSKNEHIKVLDLDFHHLLRIMFKYLQDERYLLDSQRKLDISRSLGKILNEIGEIQKGIND